MIDGLNTLMAHLRTCYDQKKDYKTGWWSSLNEYPIMFALMSMYQPTRVLECGTCSGASAMSWAVGMQCAQLDPRVYTFDPANRNKVYTETGWEEYIHFFNEPWIEGEKAKELLSTAVHGCTFVFIDGNHLQEACYADAVQALTYLKPGDVLAFHDAIKYRPIMDAVTDALEYTKVKPARRYTIASSCGIEVLEL